MFRVFFYVLHISIVIMDRSKIVRQFLLISSIFYIADADLCEPNLFGIACRFQCHCKGNKQCDPITGQCPSECDPNWAGPSCQYRNIALAKMFTEHSGSTTKSNRAVDGDVTTCTDLESDKSKPWWRIWLSNNYIITELEIVINESNKDNFKQFKVTVEHVPEELATQTLSEYIVPKEKTCYENNAKISNRTIHVVCDKPLEGNQVRIRLGGRVTQLSICDVRIFQGRNIAFGRRTLQSSDTTDGGNSSAAVDGLTNRVSTVCSATSSESRPWWTVDLAHVIVIKRIIITTLDAKAKGYEILVSNDSLIWESVNQDVSPSSTKTNVSLDVRARFVNITLGGTQQLKLCEVQILGDCLPNVCGFDCSQPCYCKTYSANSKMSGICPDGCLENWTGQNMFCDTVVSCEAPSDVKLSAVAFSMSILGAIVFTAVLSVLITIFVMKRRQSSSSSSKKSASGSTSRNESQNETRTGGSGQLSRIRKRVLSLYYNTALRPKSRKSNAGNTEELAEYDDLELPPRRRAGFEGYTDLENKIKQLGKVKV